MLSLKQTSLSCIIGIIILLLIYKLLLYIDYKISNISINIPPIKLKQPKVIIKYMDRLDAIKPCFVYKKNNLKLKKIQNNTIIETNDSNINEKDHIAARNNTISPIENFQNIQPEKLTKREQKAKRWNYPLNNDYMYEKTDICKRSQGVPQELDKLDNDKDLVNLENKFYNNDNVLANEFDDTPSIDSYNSEEDDDEENEDLKKEIKKMQLEYKQKMMKKNKKIREYQAFNNIDYMSSSKLLQ